MGVPENLHFATSPRAASVPPIQVLGTPRASLIFEEDIVGAMTPKTPVDFIPSFENFFNKSALIDAVERGDVSEVSALIESNVDVDETYVCNVTPLIVATRNGHEEIVEHLLEAGASVDKKDTLGRTSLMWACICFPQNEFIVWRLLNAGASREGVMFGYGMSETIVSLLQEFDAGLLLPRNSEKTLDVMLQTNSKLLPDFHKIIISFLTLTLPSLKKTI